jgi:hypothetical protein
MGVYVWSYREIEGRHRFTLVFIFFPPYIHIYVGHLSTKSGLPHPLRFWFSANGTRTHLVLYYSGHSISPRLYRFSRSHPLYAVPGTTYSTHCVMCMYCVHCFARIPHNRSENRHQGLTVAQWACRICRWSYRSATTADRVKNACKCSRRLFIYESFARPKFFPIP